ncbi:hypothetical protein [Paenibacillus popilliae]|nr:hypothetical protein [Paenibacillus popilliae]
MYNDNKVLFASDGRELIVNHLYTIEDYFTFDIKVKSGEFTGASNFCMPKEKVIFMVESLSKMLQTLEGYCEVKDYDTDANVVLEMEKLGHMCIYGQLGGSHEEHSMKFKYTADQTVAANLMKMLKALL